MVCLGSTFLQDAADLGNTQRNSKQQQQRQQQRRWRRRRRRVMSFRLNLCGSIKGQLFIGWLSLKASLVIDGAGL